MSLQDKAERLFQYISQFCAIDLPISRDIRRYGAELWWQAEIIQCSQCELRGFDGANNHREAAEGQNQIDEDAWLSVSKKSFDSPPVLPFVLQEWVELSSTPTKPPTARESISKRVSFDADERRTTAFNGYVRSWEEWKQHETTEGPPLPDILSGWIDLTQSSGQLPSPMAEREILEKFEDNELRVTAFKTYLDGPWRSWSQRVLPFYHANTLYDELFSLCQRLSVERDRLELIWGHLFLAWNHSAGNLIGRGSGRS